MIRAAISALCFLAVLPAAAQTVDMDALARLPVPEQAENLLGAAGAVIGEIHVRPDSLSGGYRVDLAAVPRWSGQPGLCEANIYTLRLSKPEASRSRVERIDIQPVYRVFGSTEPLVSQQLPGGWSASLQLRYDRYCARTGPVFPDGSSFPRHFFSGAMRDAVFDRRGAWFAARALEKAHASTLPINCGEPWRTSPSCANARALLARVPVSDVTHYTIDMCPDQRGYCVRVVIPSPDEPGYAMALIISTNLPWLSHQADFEVRALDIERRQLAF